MLTAQKTMDAMNSVLTSEDREELSRIYAPTVVAVPITDARASLCVMPDGELRCYGFRDKSHIFDYTHGVYMSSRDCGLSWKIHPAQPPYAAAGTRLSNGKYLALTGTMMAETGFSPSAAGLTEGFWAIHYDAPGSKDYRLVKVSDEPIRDMYLPIELSSGRVVCTAHVARPDGLHPVFLFSDDMGETWQYRVLPAAPRHEAVWPHKGLRWQNGSSEPTVTELRDGRLYLLARTSLDVFYEYYSTDGGETWTEPEPSCLHGTLTSPQLLRLNDGRILCFYNNSQPLPELDHETQWPPVDDYVKDGTGEDVFTNRDVNHVAISEDDGKSWLGLRELALNDIRNAADFRTRGNIQDSLDKSIHQFQAIQLPMNKILVMFGQNPVSRRMVIFDIDWLYETKRREDFRFGMQNVSTQVYLTSVSGHQLPGHCAWNRTNGAVPMPDPDGSREEAMFISRICDPRLLFATQGVVWNFPAAKSGKVTMRIRIDGGPLHITLADRWFNPVDETVAKLGQAHFTLKREQLPQNTYSDMILLWENDICRLEKEGKTLGTVSLSGDAPNGISYLILQSPYTGEDKKGCWIKYLEKE